MEMPMVIISMSETSIKAGDIFLLFPGEWHTYGPLPNSKWKSYWIGFKGLNMDSRVANGFLSAEKPIYHVGYSAEIVALYNTAEDVQALLDGLKQVREVMGLGS